jgi:hypothetical protein
MRSIHTWPSVLLRRDAAKVAKKTPPAKLRGKGGSSSGGARKGGAAGRQRGGNDEAEALAPRLMAPLALVAGLGLLVGGGVMMREQIA